MSPTENRLPPVGDLAEELFRLVENDQGKGFVSDGMGVLPTHKDFFDILRIHLKHSDSAVRKMRRFLKKYSEAEK